MKRWIIFFTVLFIFLSGSLINSNLIEAGIFPFKVHKKVLANGFKIIVIPLAHPGITSYYSIVRAGSKNEYEPGHTGFAHLMEHLMFRGTKTNPGSMYTQKLIEMGVDGSGGTYDDVTFFTMSFDSEDLEKIMVLESDRFQNLDYGEQEFKTEAGAVLGEFLKGKNDAEYDLYKALHFTAFDVHTYKHTAIGLEPDVRAMPTMYEYSKQFYNRYYRPENVVLVVCGDVQPEKVFTLAEQYYSPWQKGYVPPVIATEPEQQAPRSKQIAFPGQTLPILTVGYKSLPFDALSKDYVATYILGDIVFGQTSTFYTRIVLEQQKAMSVITEFSRTTDPHLNSVIIPINNVADVPLIKQEVANSIIKYQTVPMEKETLDALKSNLKYSFLMGLTSSHNVAEAIQFFIAITGDIDAIDQYYDTLDHITPADIQRAAAKYFTDNRKSELVVVGE